VISQVVIGIIFSWFYNPRGVIGPFLDKIGLGNYAILADENFATYGIIFAGIYPQIAYCMILYLTGLNNLNTDQIEAGRMDGAKGLSLFKNIILPQLKPATFLAIVVTVIGSLRSFDMVAIMTQGGPYGSSNVLAYYMFETALSEYGYRMGYGSAIAAVLFTIMMFYILFFIYRMYQSEKKGL
jgi:multiple sugar transport system permease protein